MSTGSRTYRFPSRDRNGWLLGLQAAQCVILGVGIFVGGILLNVGAPAPVILVTVCASGIAAFAPLAGRPGYTWIPVIAAWLMGRSKTAGLWTAPIPRFRVTRDQTIEGRLQPTWPRFIHGVEIHEHDGWRPNSKMAVIYDSRTGTRTGLLRVTGREFSLIDRADQEHLLAGWGDTLAAFCKERSPVTAVRWFEWSAPADASAHLEWTRDHVGTNTDAKIVDDYIDMVAAAGPMSTRHETIVTVTVGGTRGWTGRRVQDRNISTQIDTLRDELRLLASRLESTGLIVDPPLTSSDAAELIRLRLDPFGQATQQDAGRTLAELAGIRQVQNAGPMATKLEWSHLVVDGAVHACFAIVEWPRLEVPPNWMEPLLLHAGGIRTVAVHLEPVAPSKSQRQVDKDSTRLVVDAEQRSRSGFRVGAHHRRAETDVAEREAEIVAGYYELEFCGLVTVTAANCETLERSCAEWQQIAAQSGIQLRRLNGQHDTAFACTLPLGIGPSRGSWE